MGSKEELAGHLLNEDLLDHGELAGVRDLELEVIIGLAHGQRLVVGIVHVRLL